MSIHVSCKCGKQFKVKEHLAGKAVRCPHCKSPLRVPGDETPAAVARPSGKSSGKSGGESAPNVVDALARYEEAQRRKQKSLEDEAAYKAEQNKLIESYDQLTGRGKTEGDKKAEAAGKKRPTEVVPTKPTIITKLADAFGAVMSNLFVKYVIIAALLGGGVYGSVRLVQFLTHGVERQIKPQMRKEDRVRLLLKEARQDVDAKRWQDADVKLKEIASLDRKLTEINRDYKRCREAVDQALGPTRP